MEYRLSPVALGFLVLLAGLARAEAPDGALVTISRQDCRRLSLHVPEANVAYRPGVDAHGRAVTPADLGGAPQIALPETIAIAIEVDLQDRFGIPANPESFDADASIGTVEVDAEGRARFNGQPLQDEAQADLARRCQEILRGKP